MVKSHFRLGCATLGTHTNLQHNRCQRIIGESFSGVTLAAFKCKFTSLMLEQCSKEIVDQIMDNSVARL